MDKEVGKISPRLQGIIKSSQVPPHIPQSIDASVGSLPGPLVFENMKISLFHDPPKD